MRGFLEILPPVGEKGDEHGKRIPGGRSRGQMLVVYVLNLSLKKRLDNKINLCFQARRGVRGATVHFRLPATCAGRAALLRQLDVGAVLRYRPRHGKHSFSLRILL